MRELKSIRQVWRPALALAVMLATAWPLAGALSDEDATAKFEAANILYEKGQFEPAARAYEELIASEVRTASLLFNAGNAWFKAGKTGRAVAWWLQAESLEPRNDRIQVNLEFARKSVNGGTLALPRWPAPLRWFTLDEWAGAVLVAGWLFFGSLTMKTWKPAWRAWFRLPAALGGVALVVTLTLLVITVRDRTDTVVAVVVKDEAVVRYGPLPESQSAFVARDGAEFVVTDRKDAWLRVEDHQGRFGWLLESQVVQLRAGRVLTEAAAPGRTEPLQALVETSPGLAR
jgi:tetratricopeptide (TPR) repeat protein